MEIHWEDFILEEPKTQKSFVQPKSSLIGGSITSRPSSRKQSTDSKASKASGDSNVIFSKAGGEMPENDDGLYVGHNDQFEEQFVNTNDELTLSVK